MRWQGLMVPGMILLGICEPAPAHQVNLSTARLALSAERSVKVEVALKGSDVDRLVGTKVYDAKEDAVDPAAVDAANASILAYMRSHLAVTGADGEACPAGTAAILADGDGVIYRNNFNCASVAGDVVYRSTVLTAKDSSARQVVLVAQGETEAQALLDGDNTTITLSAPTPSLWSTMQRYLLTGIEHIFLGYDHIAFLVAVVLWARRLIPVIKMVTAFTIAHSITLSLAALGVLVIPSRIVEPAIAASIVFVAVENFFSRDIDRRWRVTFLFGLIHGFGFAGALQEIGLPPNAVVPALGSFNIGVEIGQVAIVVIVLPVLGLVDRLFATDRSQPVRATRVVYAVSAVISLLGGYWLLTRVFEA
ncbi:HupE/UreJ family protein [Bradyrhizobium guangdongense]|uniref:HupE/UreJ family protein n=1 Tax=Bradyrhizobium guangdongense TaxID=1325090 RepID=UPI001FDAA89A|nr:HupE/UreJ family protein [Bradyrhizobium guangdongense]